MKRTIRNSAGIGATSVAAIVLGGGLLACLNTSEDAHEGSGTLFPVGTLELNGFNVSTSGVQPDVSGECFPACRSGEVCVSGRCVSDGPGIYCTAIIRCVCPEFVTEWPSCAEETAGMSESACETTLRGSFPDCLP